ncbi:hypothetical protein DFH08DRAFT_964258 [Mycena albidolilacea]|uniref:F-box domain-containing protein n=1 Tax=Mycena albidolilacea TaxID=1033008 RepID=A0AAD6ZU57_9AGAR|nr:hypothetical protein DFH08DRAFT_964258 [Mycena albidolilacea]
MDQSSPLKIQELLDHCLSYLHSLNDLKSCARVSRFWVYAAQSRIFRAPHITNGSWNHLLEALASSPHLISHIRQLDIQLRQPEATTTLSTVCGFPFTHVNSIVFVYESVIDPSAVAALQYLLALPTLRRVELQCTFGTFHDFTCLWASCVSGSGIRHVALVCTPHRWIMSNTHATVFSPSPQGGEGGGIALQSLSLHSTEMLDYNLLAHSCLFDLSRLKTLSIGWRARIPWREFAPHVTSVEELDVVLNGTISALAPLLSLSFPSASAFPKLTTLRLSLPVWLPPQNRLAFAGELFAGLRPSASITANVNAHGNVNSYRAHGNENTSKLCALVLSADAGGHGPPDGALCTLLDGAAVELGVELKLEVDAESYAGIWPFFLGCRLWVRCVRFQSFTPKFLFSRYLFALDLTFRY